MAERLTAAPDGNGEQAAERLASIDAEELPAAVELLRSWRDSVARNAGGRELTAAYVRIGEALIVGQGLEEAIENFDEVLALFKAPLRERVWGLIARDLMTEHTTVN